MDNRSGSVDNHNCDLLEKDEEKQGLKLLEEDVVKLEKLSIIKVAVPCGNMQIATPATCKIKPTLTITIVTND